MPDVTTPLVSVIIPCFNAERFLEKAVCSILQQTYSNLEIIVVNDCSTDKSLLILEKLQAKDPRMMIISNDQNLKISKTLNAGIDISKGKYIARMDADDICINDRIEKQVAFLEHHSDIAICGGSFLKIDDQDKITGKVKFPTGNDTLKAELLFYCPFAHPTMMIRKSALETSGYYKDMMPAEDYELWLTLAESFKVANLPGFLIYYRTHGSSITSMHRDKLHGVLNFIVQTHKKTSGFAEEYLSYHLKFIEGTWNRQSSKAEIENIHSWKKEILKLHKNNPAISKVFDKYISLAMLSILKSKSNNMEVKIKAMAKLFTINPFITLKHFFR